VVRDQVHGKPLAVGLCLVEGARLPQSVVLCGILGGRARGADNMGDVFAAVLAIHVQEDYEAVRGYHTIRTAGDMRQLTAGVLLLVVVAQSRAACQLVPLRTRREELGIVVLVAPLRRLKRSPLSRDDLYQPA